jgi:uncharacterized pyridoxal phosphate-containing UPF0001 family protein
METFIDRLMIVRERIAAAAQRAHRDPATIRLVGVTKAQPVEAIRAALDAGLRARLAKTGCRRRKPK